MKHVFIKQTHTAGISEPPGETASASLPLRALASEQSVQQELFLL